VSTIELNWHSNLFYWLVFVTITINEDFFSFVDTSYMAYILESIKRVLIFYGPVKISGIS
jgi:hypothetical protein